MLCATSVATFLKISSHILIRDDQQPEQERSRTRSFSFSAGAGGGAGVAVASYKPDQEPELG